MTSRVVTRSPRRNPPAQFSGRRNGILLVLRSRRDPRGEERPRPFSPRDRPVRGGRVSTAHPAPGAPELLVGAENKQNKQNKNTPKAENRRRAPGSRPQAARGAPGIPELRWDAPVTTHRHRGAGGG